MCNTFHLIVVGYPSIHEHLVTDVRQTIDAEVKHHQNVSSDVSLENTVQVSPT